MDDGQITNLTFEIGAAANKQKLGDYLFENLRGLSKMYLRELIKTGKCEVNGGLENSGYLLRPNDFIELEADLSRGTAMRPENIPLDIVFEDDELVVVNKPAGMLVHPSHRENSGTLLNALVYHVNKEVLPQRRGDAEALGHSGDIPPSRPLAVAPSVFIRPGLPHRLDKQTSGLIVVTKTARAHRILSGHFMRKRVEKRYAALVEGIVKDDRGTIVAPIGRFAELKYWGVRSDGKQSESRYRVRERFADTTLLELEPVTGRTNQLRIHCEVLGHPIVGDMMRGGRESERLCLHACSLAFPHPSDGRRLLFVSDIDFTAPAGADCDKISGN